VFGRPLLAMITYHQQGIESGSGEHLGEFAMVLKNSCLLSGLLPSAHFPEHLTGVSDHVKIRGLWRPFQNTVSLRHTNLGGIWKCVLGRYLFRKYNCNAICFWNEGARSSQGYLHTVFSIIPLPCLALSRWYLESNLLLPGCLTCCIQLEANMLNFDLPVHNT
jgi:hypothetical protein